MLTMYFREKLQKLNKRLWVDVTNRAYPYHKDFPTAGLYHDTEYLMAVGHNIVPEYTIIEKNTERVLAPGYRAIVDRLIRKGLVNKKQAERVFNCEFFDKPKPLPKRELDFEWEAG